ncbi:ribbon-helix-helix protein, CopG family (plasmid) [Bacillus cereus]|nr:ribbon-helix-helix protein, CopG family [Bacillus cereus]UIJ70206.1 ribbon-helix-helix protein, CopG family [Bacillus cereus]
MVRKKVGITLTDETLGNLDEICKKTGLTKSQVIALLINTHGLEKFSEKK